MYDRTAECCTSSEAPRWKTRGSRILLLFAIFTFLTVFEKARAMPSREYSYLDEVSLVRATKYQENVDPIDEDEGYPTSPRLSGNPPNRGDGNSREGSSGYRSRVGSSHRHSPEITQRNNFLTIPDSSCEGTTFCENTSSPYPIEYIRNLITTSPKVYAFAGVDDMADISNRFNPSDGEIVCDSETSVVFPKAALNKDGKWVVILQDEMGGYRQGVRVEKCGSESVTGTCSIIEDQVPGYKSSCKQKYVSRILVSINETGNTNTDRHAMPSSCCCEIKGTTASRIGGSLLRPNQSPAPRPSRRRNQRTAK